jgi:glyoxylase-like metal-dependent hydrolase (beta-lactamase superfamily II)
MLIQEPGKINDRIYFLGTHKTCLYLITGKEAMIFGGGMAITAPYLEKQFSEMDVNLDKIRYLVIPHSHFDHCGAVPYLKGKFPWLQIIASAHSKEVFSKGKVMEFIANANREVVEKWGLRDEYERLKVEFNHIQVDRVVGEGDIIDLGDGIRACFMEVPGHSKCSIAAYVPRLRAMFPSDATPCPTEDGKGLVYPSPQYDFSLYLASLRKLATYEVEICGFDHHGAFIGNEARYLLRQGLEQVEKFKDYVMEQYQKIGDFDRLAQNFAAEAVERNKFNFLNSELVAVVARTVLRKILGQTN